MCSSKGQVQNLSSEYVSQGDSPGVVFPRLEVPREAQIVACKMKGPSDKVYMSALRLVCLFRWHKFANLSLQFAGLWITVPGQLPFDFADSPAKRLFEAGLCQNFLV